jgi:carboxyl-terminal processing protease
LLALALVTSPGSARDGKETPYKAGPLAHRAWVATDLVLERHLDPPARQQMLLGGIKSLLRHTRSPLPPGLGARVSAVSTEDQYAALLEEFWPPKAGAPVDELEADVLHGLLEGPREEGPPGGYLTPREVNMVEVLTGNRYVGTGIQIRQDPKHKLAQIVVPFPGGPARKAGARVNDLITEVDGVSMTGKTLGEVVKRLQGEEGTPVSMTVRQPDAKETRVLKMIRSVVPFASVLGFRRLSEEGWSFKAEPASDVGYLRITDLNAATLLQLRKVEPLVRADGVRALVLDLRFTMGSEMHHARLVADAFLDGGLLWRERDARGRTKEYRADRDCLFRDWPLAVLVGEQTGGMAEAVAAALQDNGRAVVVGEPTRGRGVVTSLIPLPDGSGALKIPTGVVVRAGKPGKSEEAPLSDAGVRPDQPMSLDREKLDSLLGWLHQQESPEPAGPSVKPPEDRQLAKALAVLRERLAKLDQGKKDKATP